MANRVLSAQELKVANKLLQNIRNRLEKLAKGDRRLLFAYRRKIYKELTYDERGKPMHRRKLKLQKWEEQKRKCAECHKKIPLKDSEMDRINGMAGYTLRNIRVVHHACHRRQQETRQFR